MTRGLQRAALWAVVAVLWAPWRVDAQSVRVFAMQYHLHPGHVAEYDSLYRKIDAFLDDIRRHLAKDRPNLVVFNEDTGLATLATGARFATTRALQSQAPLSNPLYSVTEPTDAPLGVGAAFGSLAVGYSKEMAVYQARFPGLTSKRAIVLAATDTMVRSFYNAFARLARELNDEQLADPACTGDCRVIVVAGNNMAPFREVSFAEDPSVRSLVDPEILAGGDSVAGQGGIADDDAPVASAFVATVPEVYNTVFVWGPGGTEIGQTRKVNLTPLEGPLLLDLSHGSIDDVQPIPIAPGIDMGIGISLDAFQYGEPACLGEVDGCQESEVCVEHPPVQPDPLSHAITAETYMRCLDARGVNLFVQPEANPRRWADRSDGGQWQALTWMRSDWRAVSDSTVGFRYTVVPFMVGNLIDLVFDGQSAVYERGRTTALTAVSHRVGTLQVIAGDDPGLAPYAGGKSETVALAPWVVAEGPATYTSGRNDLRAVTARLAPGSGDALENQYLETVLCADLDLAPGGSGSACAGFTPPLRPGGTAD